MNADTDRDKLFPNPQNKSCPSLCDCQNAFYKSCLKRSSSPWLRLQHLLLTIDCCCWPILAPSTTTSARFNLQHSGISWYQVVNFLPSRCEHCGPEMRCRCLPSVQQQVPSSQCSPLFCCFWCIRIMSWDFSPCYCNGPKYTELVLDCNELWIESTWLGTIGKEACVDPVEKPRCL